MTPDMLHAQGFAVSFPGQISREYVIEAFTSSPPRADVDLSNYKVLEKPAHRHDFTHISRFSDPQRRIIYVANMCFLGLMRGEVYLPQEQQAITPFQVPFQQKIASMIDNPIPKSLTEAMVSASKSTLTDFDSNYPSLTPAMQQQLEIVGASGMARAIILSAQEARRLHKTRFQTVYHAAGINGISFTDCLGPAIGRQMMSDALGVVADLRTLGIEPNLTVEDLPGVQADMASQILGVFREINLKNISAKYNTK